MHDLSDLEKRSNAAVAAHSARRLNAQITSFLVAVPALGFSGLFAYALVDDVKPTATAIFGAIAAPFLALLIFQVRAVIRHGQWARAPSTSPLLRRDAIEEIFSYESSVSRTAGWALLIVFGLIGVVLTLMAVNQFAAPKADSHTAGLQFLLAALVPFAVAGVSVVQFRRAARHPAAEWLRSEPDRVKAVSWTHTRINASGSAVGGYYRMTVLHDSGSKARFRVTDLEGTLKVVKRLAPQATATRQQI